MKCPNIKVESSVGKKGICLFCKQQDWVAHKGAVEGMRYKTWYSICGHCFAAELTRFINYIPLTASEKIRKHYV